MDSVRTFHGNFPGKTADFYGNPKPNRNGLYLEIPRKLVAFFFGNTWTIRGKKFLKIPTNFCKIIFPQKIAQKECRNGYAALRGKFCSRWSFLPRPGAAGSGRSTVG